MCLYDRSPCFGGDQQDALKGCSPGHLCRFVHTDYARLLSCPPLPWLTPLMLTGTGHRHSTCSPVTLLYCCRLPCEPNVPSPSWCQNLQVLPYATLAGVLSPNKTSLALLMVQVYGLYYPFAAAEALRYCCSGELPTNRPSSCCSTSECFCLPRFTLP